MNHHALLPHTLAVVLGCLALVLLAETAAASGKADARFDVQDDGKNLIVRLDGKPMMRYRYAGGVFKPYVAELYLPDGRNVVRDAPHDHLHHHGLMFAWNVDGVEFWGEAGPVGRQVHRRFTRRGPGRDPATACIAEDLDWVAADGKKVLLADPVAVYVHKVYYSGDFSALGIGVD